MKRRCPLCAEEIQAKAKLCKHCKSAVKPVETYSKLGCLLTLALLALGTYLGITNVELPDSGEPKRAAATRPAEAK